MVLSGTSAINSVSTAAVKLVMVSAILEDDRLWFTLILTVAVAGPSLSNFLQEENSRTTSKTLNKVMKLRIKIIYFLLFMLY